MSWWLGTVIVGITAFAATNIDDIVILMIFFGQTNEDFRPKHILIGQYLGFSALILASLPGFFGGLVIPRAWIGLLGFLPIAIAISHLLKSNHHAADIDTIATDFPRSQKTSMFAQVINVAAVTFANGGDNIGIYVPLFASSDLARLGVILVTFLIGIALWCYIAYRLARQPTIARMLSRHSQAIVPFVLIGLGIYILLESETYHLLPKFF